MNMDHEFLYKCIQCSVFSVEIIQLAVLLIRGGTFCAPVQVQRLINVKFLPLSPEIFKPTRNYFFENSMLLILPCLIKRIIIWRRKNFEISLPKSLQKLITWSRIIKVRLGLQPNLFLPLKERPVVQTINLRALNVRDLGDIESGSQLGNLTQNGPIHLPIIESPPVKPKNLPKHSTNNPDSEYDNEENVQIFERKNSPITQLPSTSKNCHIFQIKADIVPSPISRIADVETPVMDDKDVTVTSPSPVNSAIVLVQEAPGKDTPNEQEKNEESSVNEIINIKSMPVIDNASRRNIHSHVQVKL